jgi:membrane protease YdiL (CAAX protease family)
MDEKNYPEPVEALVVILITFGVVLAVAFIFAMFLFTFSPNTTVGGNTKLIYILGGIPLLVVPIIYINVKKYNLRELFRLNPVSGDVIFLSVLVGLALGPLSDELDRLIQIVIPLPQWFMEQLKFMQAETLSDWILLFLGVVALASISEELIFRGFLQVTLERKGDITRAVILSSISWTLIHVNPYWAIQIFVMGIIIGFMAWRTNSIFPPIIVHAVNNFMSLLFFNFGEDLHWYLLGNHVTPWLLVLSLAVLVWSIRKMTAIFQTAY